MASDHNRSCPQADIHPNLREKWMQVFHFTDLDGDGLHSTNECDIMMERLKVAHIDPDKKQEILEMFEKVWANSLGADHTKILNCEQWLEKLKKLHASGALVEITDQVRREFFKCTDLKNDGVIDPEEFKNFNEIIGKKDSDVFEKAFSAMDVDKSGVISLTKYLDAYKKYMCDESVTMNSLPLYGVSKRT